MAPNKLFILHSTLVPTLIFLLFFKEKVNVVLIFKIYKYKLVQSVPKSGQRSKEGLQPSLHLNLSLLYHNRWIEYQGQMRHVFSL